MDGPIISDEFCSRNPTTNPTLKNSLPDPNITVFWVHRFVKCICSNCVFFSFPVEFLLAFALLFPRKPFHPCRPSQVRDWNYPVNYWPSSKSSAEFFHFLLMVVHLLNLMLFYHQVHIMYVLIHMAMFLFHPPYFPYVYNTFFDGFERLAPWSNSRKVGFRKT